MIIGLPVSHYRKVGSVTYRRRFMIMFSTVGSVIGHCDFETPTLDRRFATMMGSVSRFIAPARLKAELVADI